MKLIQLIILLFLSSFSIAQTTLTFKPDTDCGKDAIMTNSATWSNGTTPISIPQPSSTWLRVEAWTANSNGSPEHDWRSLIEFEELKEITNIDLIQATLKLYAYPNFPYSNGGQAEVNDVEIFRVIETWEENQVSWATQPNVDPSLQIIIPQNNNYDFIEVDVTAMVQIMLDNPNNSFGFLLKQIDESPYGSMDFASSDYADYARAPELILVGNNIDVINYPTEIFSSEDTSLCINQSLVLNVDDPLAIGYLWNNGSTNNSLNVFTSGEYSVTRFYNNCFSVTDTLNVEIGNLPNAGIANPPTSLCNMDSEIIDLQNELIGEDLNGVWSETSILPSVGTGFNALTGEFNTIGQAAGTYTFEYFIAGTGICPDAAETVTIILEESPLAIIAPSEDLNCDIQTTELDGSNSFGGLTLSYQWLTSNGNIISGANTSNPTINESGDYVLIVQLPNGCTSTTTIQINQDIQTPNVEAGLDQQLTCTNSQEVTLNGSSMTSGVIYTWSGPGINSSNENEQNPVVQSPGVYTLISTNPNNNCESQIDSVEVIENFDTPSFTLASLFPLDCDNSSQLLNGPLGVNFSYQWSLNGNIIIGATNSEYEAMQPGLYSLQITNTTNGCNTIESVQVDGSITPPSIDAGITDMLTCVTTTVTLTGSTMSGSTNSYQWFDPNNNPISNSNSLTIDVSQSGNYTLVATNLDNGCTASDIVIVEADSNFPIADAGENAILDCEFNDIQIGNNSSTGTNIIYSWTTISGGTISNSNNATATVNEPGTYQIQVTDISNNCTATDQVIVSENTNLPTIANFDNSPISCNGETDGAITISSIEGGTPPYQYSLNGSDFSDNNNYSFLDAGQYSITVLDALGCELETEMTLVDPLPFIINLGPDTIIELGQSININANFTTPYDSLWWRLDSTLPCDNCPSQLVSPEQTTTYIINGLDGNGCIDSDEITVFVEKNRHVFIPNAFTPNNDGMNDIFYIHGGIDVEKIRSFKIFNRWGETIFAVNNIDPNDITKGWNGYFNGKEMNPSVYVYFAEIEFKDGHVIIYKGDFTLWK